MKIVLKNELHEAVHILNSRGVIAYPTETVYGLGGLISEPDIVSRIRDLKGREDTKPMLILIPDEAYLFPIVEFIHPKASLLMRQFWPGPLTLIFKIKGYLPEDLIGKNGGVGIRISSDTLCQELLSIFQAPLISTSANPSGKPPARSCNEVVEYFGNLLDGIIDDGVRNKTMPSTVLDVRSEPFKLIRPGAITEGSIEKTIGEMIVNQTM